VIGTDVRRAALVVAHPDDETLWCAGLLLRHPILWTVIACSIPRRDPVRAWKFYEACEALEATPRLLPYIEAEPAQPLSGLQLLDLSGFDLVVTHGAAGEYGHAQHRQVHQHVKAAARPGQRLAFIGWHRGGVGAHRLELTSAERARKTAALRCYDHTSPADGGKPKWQALLRRYVDQEGLDLGVETYDLA
jgi:LmbE family N-acetylglucosaminyl deacetylase